MSVIYKADGFYILDHGSSLVTNTHQPSPGLFYQKKQYFTSKKLAAGHNLCDRFKKLGYPVDRSKPKYAEQEISDQVQISEQGETGTRKRRKIDDPGDKIGTHIWLLPGSVKSNKNCRFAEDCSKLSNVSPYPVTLISQTNQSTKQGMLFPINDESGTVDSNEKMDETSDKPDLTLKYSGLFNKFTINNNSKSFIIRSNESDYLIPPNSSFLMSDIEHFESIAHFAPAQKYNFITLDPPWVNKSVRRGKKYQMTENVFDKMDIPRLLADDAIVAVWVTNKPIHVEYILNTLFPSWGLELELVCFWLKVTSSGLPIVPFGSPHKKPYEMVIVGKRSLEVNDESDEYKFDTEVIKRITEFPWAILDYIDFVFVDAERNKNSRACSPFPEVTSVQAFSNPKEDPEHGSANKMIISSIPCVQHSRKPPLNLLKEMFFPTCADVTGNSADRDVNCLELFARSLLEGWHSWGNEVLIHQNLDFYERIDKPKDVTNGSIHGHTSPIDELNNATNAGL